MKLRKGDVVVVTTRDPDVVEFLVRSGAVVERVCICPGEHYLGIVHCVGGGYAGVMLDYSHHGFSMDYEVFETGELIKIDHIHKRDWSGLDLPGFYS